MNITFNSVDELVRQLSKIDDVRLLRKIPFSVDHLPLQLSEPNGDEIELCILDLETTGLSFESDKIIEIGMVKVTFSPSKGCLVSVLDAVSMLQDPGMPIPADTTSVNGITDEDVMGMEIDMSVMHRFMDSDPIVIAHRASFDRHFFDSHFSQFRELRWLCTVDDVAEQWKAHFPQSVKLEFMVMKSGYFYDAHRAVNDCFAVLQLLITYPDILHALMSSVEQPKFVIRLFSTPYHLKDSLSQRGYTFNSDLCADKHWHKTVMSQDDVYSEGDFLESIYAGAVDTMNVTEVTARERFKSLLLK